MEKIKGATIVSHGITQQLCERIATRWLNGIAETNPAILAVFSDRDVRPYRDLLAWSGEFAGKYLTGAYFVWRQTGDGQLKAYVLNFIERLLKLQDSDGYFGCFSRATRFTGALPQTPDKRPWTWDLWGNYHIAFGLLLWHKAVGEERYFRAVEKLAELVRSSFYGEKENIVAAGCSEMNLAVYHLFGILYNATGEKKYFEFMRNIEEDMQRPESGNWLELLASGGRFCDSSKPRWESLHILMGFKEAYAATGDKKYLTALSRAVKSIFETDVHNTGGFSTHERAIGTPYENGTIETCCVVAFDALVLELYKLTGEPSLIDFLERAHYNAAMGAVSPSGAWATYDTPMEGEKFANFHGCDFQSRPGGPMLNCCSVNFPRGVAESEEWSVAEDEAGIYLNGFEPKEISREGLRLKIESNYPAENRILIFCEAEGEKKKIFLRIPDWSKNTRLVVNGEIRSVRSGEYVRLPQNCKAEFFPDFSVRFEKGGGDYSEKYSIFRGPVLFAWDVSFNPDFSDLNGGNGFTTAERLNELNLPVLRFSDFERAEYRKEEGKIEMILPGGAVLVDFFHAGETGGLYKTWLSVQ